MMKTNLKKLLAFTLAALFSTVTIAGEMSKAPQFESLDKDQDGKLTVEEASQDPKLSNYWKDMDKDASGTIDKSEFSAFEATMKKEEKKPAAQ